MRFDRPSPAPPLSRASLVVGLYGAIALLGLMLSAGRGDPDVYRLADPPAWVLPLSPGLGLAAGPGVVGLRAVAGRGRAVGMGAGAPRRVPRHPRPLDRTRGRGARRVQRDRRGALVPRRAVAVDRPGAVDPRVRPAPHRAGQAVPAVDGV